MFSKNFLLGAFLASTAFAADATNTTDYATTPSPSDDYEGSSVKLPSFTNMKGLGIDAAGNLYISGYKKASGVGKVAPDGKVSAFKYAGKQVFNIRSDKDAKFYLADPSNKRIHVVSQNSTNIGIRCRATNSVLGNGMVGPVDLVLGKDETVYFTAYNQKQNTGGIFACKKGETVAKKLYTGGAIYGIDLDPQEKFVYFTETTSKSKRIKKIAVEKLMAGNNKQCNTVYKFSEEVLGKGGELTTLRFDTSGIVYVAIQGSGSIAIFDSSAPVQDDNVDVLLLDESLANPKALEISQGYLHIVGDSFYEKIALDESVKGRQETFIAK
ncbi:hypothetical protein O9G_000853 [Rozella allomycis CSF55]|uniref:NHL repeat-containing protein n=1 Tax=Rozella allomycis (strain CSF55) TaxID=988480 RepID=A0A075ARB2_ROZAC|nr:hypothetical protein O9G_000853 [Rozella allomycis CSF55]|eukprot:EPZ32778.1 hypothetical protein O9G_000853 [Rozella allomycis CSF55]